MKMKNITRNSQEIMLYVEDLLEKATEYYCIA